MEPLNIFDLELRVVSAFKDNADLLREIFLRYDGNQVGGQEAIDFIVNILQFPEQIDIDAAKIIHYARQLLLEQNINDVESIALSGSYDKEPKHKTALHQYGVDGSENEKWLSEDGHSEFIVRGFDLINDSRNVGSYNFINPSDSIGHFNLDILPWTRFGNTPDDPSTILSRWLDSGAGFAGFAAAQVGPGIPSYETEHVNGDSSNERLVGDEDRNQIFGNGGNDFLIGAGGADFLDGGSGVDWAGYLDSPAGVIVDLNRGRGYRGEADSDGTPEIIVNIENILGSKFADIIIGNDADNWILGEEGNDIIYGGGGDDILDGGDGADKLVGGLGGLGGPSGTSVLRGGRGSDTFVPHFNGFDLIDDYNRGNTVAFNDSEGDLVDISIWVGVIYSGGMGGPINSFARVVTDAATELPTLQVDLDGPSGPKNWANVAHLPGLPSGEQVILRLNPATPGADGFIVYDDAAPPPPETFYSVTPSSAAVTEGETLIFKITRTGAKPEETVFFSTRADTASFADGDYTDKDGGQPLNIRLDFEKDQAQREVQIKILNDNVPDSGERFGAIVQKSPPPDDPDDHLAQTPFFVTINDAGAAPPPSGATYTLVPSATSVTEGGMVSFLIYRSPDAPAETVYFSARPDTASFAQGDYSTQQGGDPLRVPVPFLAGQTVNGITLNIRQDGKADSGERFSAVIQGNPPPGSLDDNLDETGFITINDIPVATKNGSNLVAVSFGANATGASSGGTVEVTYTVTNAGDQTSGRAEVDVVLGSTADLQSGLIADSFNLPILDPGESRTYTREVDLPVSGNGNKFLGIDVRSTTLGHDVITTDNVASIPFRIGAGLSGDPDLRPLFPPPITGVFAPGDALNVAFQITTNSNGSPPFDYRVLFSADELISPDDTVLRDATADGLGNLGVRSINLQLAVPQTAQDGVGHVIVVADPFNKIVETREDNNVRTIPFVVSSRPADANSLSNISAEDLIVSTPVLEVGQSFQFRATGYLDSPDDPFFDLATMNGVSVEARFLVSDDAVYDQSDVVFHQTFAWVDDPFGDQLELNQVVPVPRWLDTGEYFLFGVFDWADQYEEDSEADNVTGPFRVEVLNQQARSVHANDDVVEIVEGAEASINVLDNDVSQPEQQKIIFRFGQDYVHSQTGLELHSDSGLVLFVRRDGSVDVDTSALKSPLGPGEQLHESFKYDVVGLTDNNGDLGELHVIVRDTVTPALSAINRVSLGAEGVEANNRSTANSISGDGRFVAFVSGATNLVPGDTNNAEDVFVHDRLTGQTDRISVNRSGVEGNSHSSHASISDDGRFVAFDSYASNLVDDDTNGYQDVFVYDRHTGVMQRISVDSSGVQGNSASDRPSISADGRFISFQSYSSNLVPGDTSTTYDDVFVHDRLTGETDRVSIDSSGVQANFYSFDSAISSDGRYVAFSSMASNLVPDDTSSFTDKFVHDRQTGTTERVSVASDGAQAIGLYETYDIPSISADGRFVAFASLAPNMVFGDSNSAVDVFVHDRQTGQTERVSVNEHGVQGNASSGRPIISSDGRFVVFSSAASNLVDDDTANATDLYIHDRETGKIGRIAATPNESAFGNTEARVDISSDSRFISFTSSSSVLVPNDANGKADIFVAPNPLLPADTGFVLNPSAKEVSEGETVTFTITRSDVSAPETLYFSARPLSASFAEGDYATQKGGEPLALGIGFLTGQAQASVTLNVLRDSEADPGEQFRAVIQRHPLPADPADTLAQTGFITIKDAAPISKAFNDLNGDGTSDLIWRHTSGELAFWMMDGPHALSSQHRGDIPNDWSIIGKGDLDGDGNGDLIWRHTSGELAFWRMDGAIVLTSHHRADIPNDWSLIGMGDLDGDGSSDLIWRHTNGELATWLMDGPAAKSSHHRGDISNDWSLVAIGDLNGDGNSDLIWRRTDGELAFWQMDGPNVISSQHRNNDPGAGGLIPNDWTLLAIGDLNGDGSSDLIWRHAGGELAFWMMDGPNATSSHHRSDISNDWSLIRLSDLNGDGNADLIWRHASGELATWLMDGPVVLSSHHRTDIPIEWGLV